MAEQTRKLPRRIGRYVVERLLGEGGMGLVLLARDEQLDRRVAIKLPRARALSEIGRERFDREARAAAAIRHPNVCPVYEVGEHAGRPFIALAFIEGKPLSELIDPQRPLDQRRAVEIVRGVAEGLAAAHAVGVVHRDVKPHNVVLDERGEPILMDFGLARIVQTGERGPTRDGDLLGTPAYMAPEQVECVVADIGFHTDVYALGVVLYEMLTGRLPFVGSRDTIREEILRGQPIPIVRHRPDVDPALAELCGKAMSREAERRFRTAAEFAAAAAAWLQGDAGSLTETHVGSDGSEASETVEWSQSGRRSSSRTTAGRSSSSRATGNRTTATQPLGEGTTVVAAPRRRTLLIGSIVGGVGLALVLGLMFLRPWASEAARPGNDRTGNEPSGGDPSGIEPGWTELFNGEDVNGWAAVDRTANGLRPRAIGQSGWTVEDGLLKCTSDDDGYLVLPGDYGNVELVIEARMPEGAAFLLQLRRNGPEEFGPYLHVPIADGSTQQFFFDEVANLAAMDRKRRPSREQSLKVSQFLTEFDVVGPLLRPAGEWNEIRVRCVHKTMQLEVNGEPAVKHDRSNFPPIDKLSPVGKINLLATRSTNGVAIRSVRIRTVQPF
jgi:serine/threonine protein kinase